MLIWSRDHQALETGERVDPSGFLAIASPLQAQEFKLALETIGPQESLSWPSALNVPGSSLLFPEYEVQRSENLFEWTPIGGKVRALDIPSRPVLTTGSLSASGWAQSVLPNVTIGFSTMICLCS